MVRAKSVATAAKTQVSLPLAVGRGKVPISLEITVTKRRPAGGKNVAKVQLGGEEFFVVAGKTVLAH